MASINNLIDFFDTHDLGEYLLQMPEVEFEVNITKRTHLFTLDDGLANELTRIALSQNIPSSTLINSWLRERIAEQA
jgi:hypothetical protein